MLNILCPVLLLLSHVYECMNVSTQHDQLMISGGKEGIFRKREKR